MAYHAAVQLMSVVTSVCVNLVHSQHEMRRIPVASLHIMCSGIFHLHECRAA